MARARNIKPGFFTNDLLAEIAPLGRILFAGLWTLADREGRLEDRPKKIKAEILPFDNCNADKLLADLNKHGFIKRYGVDGGSYIQIVKWKKHQNPHVKEAESTIPAPDETPDKHSASTVQSTVQAPEIPERAGLIPDSLNLIPDSGFLTTATTNTEHAECATLAESDFRESPEHEKPSAAPSPPRADPDPADFDPPLYGAPLPPREDPPPPEGENQPAIALTVALRKWGVNATFTNPHVQDWAKNPKVTLDILAAAVAEARETKGNERFPPGYLVNIVERLLNPPAKTEAAAPKQPTDDWFRSKAGIERKGRELGMFARGSESHDDFKDRIFAVLRKGAKPL